MQSEEGLGTKTTLNTASTSSLLESIVNSNRHFDQVIGTTEALLARKTCDYLGSDG